MKKKILIVDDDIDILDGINIILRGEGYIAKAVLKGEETYKIVKEFQPDLILLDVLMSGSDGRTICKKLKKDKNTRHIPVIMISAHPSAAKEYMEIGADDFLAKPFETYDLLDYIKRNIK